MGVRRLGLTLRAFSALSLFRRSAFHRRADLRAEASEARLGDLRSEAGFSDFAARLAFNADIKSITLLPASATGASAREISLPLTFCSIAT